MLEAGGCNDYILPETARADHTGPALFYLMAPPRPPQNILTGPSGRKSICGAREPKCQLAGKNFFGGISVTGQLKPAWLSHSLFSKKHHPKHFSTGFYPIRRQKAIQCSYTLFSTGSHLANTNFDVAAPILKRFF